MTYAPVVLIGFGLAADTVMSLSFVTNVIGNDKVSIVISGEANVKFYFLYWFKIKNIISTKKMDK